MKKLENWEKSVYAARELSSIELKQIYISKKEKEAFKEEEEDEKTDQHENKITYYTSI